MTLPSNILPSEPATAPCALQAAGGAPCQVADSATAAVPFSSLLNWADPAPVGVPAQNANPSSPALSPASSPVLYPANYYIQQMGSPAVLLTAPDSGLPPAAEPPIVGLPAEAVCDQPPVSSTSSTKEKSKVSANPKPLSSAKSDECAVMLAYQFIAGQWVPQTPAQPSIQLSAASTVSEATQDSQTVINDGFGAPQSLPSNTSQGTAPKSVSRAIDFNLPRTNTVESNLPITAEGRTSAASPSSTFIPDIPDPAQPPTASTIVVDAKDGAHPSVVENLVRPREIPVLDASSAPAAPDTAVASAAETPGTLISNRLVEPSLAAPSKAPEKFAALAGSGRADSASGVNPLNATKEKKYLVVDGKKVTAGPINVGTSTANREIPMSYSVVNKSPSVDFSTPAGARFQPNLSAETKNTLVLAAQAPRLVQEIHTIADRVSSIDRNSVEVRFDFSDTDRLSVRVEYRDGTVHTTFKTDSSQLRDVVVTEWKSQNASNEPRSYKMADPVFSQTPSDRQNFSSTADDSGRQRSFEPQPQQTASSATYPGRTTGAKTAVATQTVRQVHPETSMHLHALA